MIPFTIRKAARLAALFTLSAIVAFAWTESAQGQGAFINGQIINPTNGRPSAYAKIRVCTQAASGNPCSPLASIYSDAAMTQQIPNPYTADQYGNYNFAVAQGYNLVQVFPMPGVTYSYMVSTANGQATLPSGVSFLGSNSSGQAVPAPYTPLPQSGGYLTGPLYTAGPPTTDAQVVNRGYLASATVAAANTLTSVPGSNCNVQYKNSSGTLAGDAGTCTDGAGNVLLTSLKGKYVSSLAMGKQLRSTSSATDGCAIGFAAGTVTCITEPGYSNDAGITVTSGSPTAHTVDNSYAGVAEVVQNTQLYGVTAQANWGRRFLYYGNDKMAQRGTGDHSDRPIGTFEVYNLSNRGRNENSGPFGQWAVAAARNTSLQSNGVGIRQLDTTNQFHYGYGDGMWHYGYITYAGSSPDASGEGQRGMAQHVTEQFGDFQGKIATVVSQTAVRTTATTGTGTYAVGRFLVDKQTAQYTGNITAASTDGTSQLMMVTTDATFTPSPWIGIGTTTVAAAANLDSPALSTVTLATSYGTSSSGLANGDHMCVSASGSASTVSGEEVIVSSLSVAGTAVTFSAPFRHGKNGTTIAFKGNCMALDATGLHETNSSGWMNALMVLGFTDSHTMAVGQWFLGSTSPIYTSLLGNLSHSCPANFSQSGTTVTAAVTGGFTCMQYFSNNSSIKVVGTTDFDTLLTGVAPSYTGLVGSNILTWAVATSATISAEAGTISTTNTSSAFTIWPMAVIYNVCDPGTTIPASFSAGNPCLNGYMELETNSVPWAVNDPVEVPHGNAMRTNGIFLNLAQYTPSNTAYMSGIQVQAAGEGWGNGAPMLDLAATDNNYLGGGGRYAQPPNGIRYRGPNSSTLLTSAPSIPSGGGAAVISVSCAQPGGATTAQSCPKTSEYFFGLFQGVTGTFGITADPSTLTIGLYSPNGAFKANAPFQFWNTTSAIGAARLPKPGNLFFDTTSSHLYALDSALAGHQLAWKDEVCLTAGCNATSVNGAAVPSSASFLASNSSSQLIATSLPIGSSSVTGIVRVDGTTITATGGIISSVPSTNATTVNSAALPLSAAYVGTNSARQIVAAATPMQPGNNLSDVANVTTARSNLGLLSMATQASSAVSISGGLGAFTTGLTLGGVQVCLQNGTNCPAAGSPSFSALTSGTNTSAAMVVGSGATLSSSGSGAIFATSLSGGVYGSLPYQSAAGVTSFLAAGATGYVLTMDPSGVPVWAASGYGPPQCTSGAPPCYQVTPGGVIEAWGVANVPFSSSTTGSVAVSFPNVGTGTPFTQTPVIEVSAGGQPNGGSDALTTYFFSPSTTGFTGVMRCATNIGGSGCNPFTGTVPLHWRARGF